MTNNELVDIYLHSMGYKRQKGDSLEPLLPFIMMDAQFQIYCKEIKPLKCKFELKKYRNEWSRAYNKFNGQFFRAFNRDQADEIIDKMDDFEAYINNDLVIAKVAIMELAKQYSLEIQNILASCLLCNILCQAAQVVWKRVYKTARMNDLFNRDIDAVQQSASRFMHAFYCGADDINCNDDDNVTRAVNALCHRMIKWLYKDEN